MAHRSTDRPDIVLFFVDQLSARWLEAARNGICDLPNFERLARRGVTFTRAYTSNPVSCPARATVATGLSTRGHGVLENGYRLDPELPTFMRELQKAGWRTGAFGKVHLRPHYEGLYPDYAPYGFDVTHITEDPRGGEWLDWVERDHPEHYESALATIWSTQIPDFAAYGPEKRDLRDRIRRAKGRTRWATDEFPEATRGAYPLPFPEEVSQTSWITGRALEFLRSVPREEPLLAQISYVQPHSPFGVPAEFLRRVDSGCLPEPAPPEWHGDPDAPAYFRGREPASGDWRWARRCYFADICHLDAKLGLVLDELERSGRLESTLVVFLSDHGELLFDHGFRGKEERHYDACVRVPLMVAGPGFARGAVCDEIVQLEDVCPTVLDVTGQAFDPMPKTGPHLKMDAAAIPQLPGRSLRELRGGDVPPRPARRRLLRELQRHLVRRPRRLGADHRHEAPPLHLLPAQRRAALRPRGRPAGAMQPGRRCLAWGDEGRAPRPADGAHRHAGLPEDAARALRPRRSLRAWAPIRQAKAPPRESPRGGAGCSCWTSQG
ncbi:MAG: sulfatase family protein [Planctomycetota bacterium]